MKKSLLFLVCCLGFGYNSHAQTDFRFADSTAQWNVLSRYDETGQYTTGIAHVDGDTIIKGKYYQKIGSIPIRRDSLDRIYAYDPFLPNDTTEYLFFDFGAHIPGTSVYVALLLGGYYSAIIDSVDAVMMGHLRKRMYVTYPVGSYPMHDVWIDGIGALYNWALTPLSPNFPNVGRSWDTTLCFYEHQQLLYHFANYDTCIYEGTHTGITDVVNGVSRIQISPNPATNQLNISIDQSLIGAQLNIYNVTGALVQSAQLQIANSKFEIQNLPNGVYIAEIKTSPKTPSRLGRDETKGDFNTIVRRWVKM